MDMDITAQCGEPGEPKCTEEEAASPCVNKEAAVAKDPLDSVDFTALPFSRESFDTACSVLGILAQPEQSDFYNSTACRSFRRQLQPFIESQKSKMFSGKTQEEHNGNKQRKLRKATELERQRQEDRQFLQRTVLRAGRMKKLEQVSRQHDIEGVPQLLDGVADDGFNDAVTLSADDHRRGQHTLTIGGAEAATATSTSTAVRDNTSTELTDESAADITIAVQGKQDTEPSRRLNGSRGCYICKRRYQVLHHFYDTLCESCAELNWRKRIQTCDLKGRIVLVTGGRVKIGFQSCLKLLRCGATVIATSRFPGDTALRYAMQNDYPVWRERLHVFGVDLRDLAAIEMLCAYLSRTFPYLDCIVNNACQTIRRPPAYYADVVATERKVEEACREYHGSVSRSNRHLEAASSNTPVLDTDPSITISTNDDGDDAVPAYVANLSNHWSYQAVCEAGCRAAGARRAGGAQRNAIEESSSGNTNISSGRRDPQFTSSVDRASMVMVAADSDLQTDILFPTQVRDVNSQQLDLRSSNSWLLTMTSGQISTPELAEVFAINAMAPFILASKLKPLLNAPRPSDNANSGATVTSECSLTLSSIMGTATTHQQQQQHQHESLAEVVLRDLQAKNVDTAVPDDDERRAKRQRNAWKGGGDISGQFTAEGSSSSSSRASNATATTPLVSASACRFIINVSSMEGKFYRRKLATHPHTNMAKAALNMMTRTSAAEYEKHNIYMTAVDTGWINDENPVDRAVRTAEKHHFSTPLDEVDAAARILDPMMAPLIAAAVGVEEERDSSKNSSSSSTGGGGRCLPPFGCFLKDYFPTEW